MVSLRNVRVISLSAFDPIDTHSSHYLSVEKKEKKARGKRISGNEERRSEAGCRLLLCTQMQAVTIVQ
jgi:hypothetical protein